MTHTNPPCSGSAWHRSLFDLAVPVSAAERQPTAQNTRLSGQQIPDAIRAVGLHKSYGQHAVFDGIDLAIPEGSIFAMLGPNGAGKTTTVRILSTLVRADGGDASVAGHSVAADPAAVRAVIGVTGQFSAVDRLLTGEENLVMIGELNGLSPRDAARRATELLERFDLADASRRLVAGYSGGMRRRLDLAMSLVSQPRVLFLDEPTTGLDPRSRQVMWHNVRDLVSEGVTIFLTTQYLEEADQLADRIAVLHAGRIVAEGSPAELKRLVPGGHIVFRFSDPATVDAAAHALGGAPRDHDELSVRVPSDGSITSVHDLINRLAERSITGGTLSIHTPDLEDVFFALTGPSTTASKEFHA